MQTSLLDAILAFQAPPLIEYLLYGLTPERNGNVNSYVAPSGVFATRDGHIMFTVLEHQWEAGCRALGTEHLRSDPRFADNTGRLAERVALLEVLRPIVAERTTEAWLAVLREHDILCAPINDYPRLVEDPQVLHNEALRSMQHASFGNVPYVRHPVRYSAATPGYTPPPSLGEHTRAVLTDTLGYSAAAVDRLLGEGAALESAPVALDTAD